MKITEITPDTIEELLILAKNKNPAKPLCNKSLKGIYGLICTIFNRAVKKDLLASNPCFKVEKIKFEKKVPEIFKNGEIAMMLSLLNTRLHEDLITYCIIKILLFTGLRRGELIGLTWDRLDFDNKRLIVSQKILYVDGKTSFEKYLKSNHAYRVISLDDKTLDYFYMLRNVYECNKEDFGDNYINTIFDGRAYNFVFRHYNGELIHPLWPWKQLKILIKALNLNPDLSLHNLRHTFASNYLKDSKCDITNLSYILGHALVSFTLDQYCHFIEDHRRTAIVALTKRLNAEIEIAATKYISENTLPITKSSHKKKLKSYINSK